MLHHHINILCAVKLQHRYLLLSFKFKLKDAKLAVIPTATLIGLKLIRQNVASKQPQNAVKAGQQRKVVVVAIFYH